MLKIISLGLFGLATAIFYGMFFKLAPYVVSVLPKTEEWSGFIEVVIYAIIAYFGGIAIPSVFLIMAISVFINSFK